MGLGTAGANASLNGLTGAGHFISAHTGDPSTTGANEAAGGTYARQSITWPAASSGSVTYSTPISIPVPAGTYTYWGCWSAVSSGSFVIGGKLAKAVTFPVAGTLTITTTQLLAALAAQ